MAQHHLRILGYVVTLVVHCINLAVMANVKKQDFPQDVLKDLKVFRGMMYRYFTCWTVMIQIINAAVGLFCELLLLKNSKKKKYILNKNLSGFRNILFSAIVWPSSWMVCTVFWSLFLYDRSLIFPEFIDLLLSKTSNHIIHTAIVPFVVWESIFRPRARPKSDARNLMHLTVHMLVYLAVFYYTYIKEGVWLYPIFEVTYGSFNFVLLHIIIGINLIVFYYLQWILNYIVHGSQDRIKKKK